MRFTLVRLLFLISLVYITDMKDTSNLIEDFKELSEKYGRDSLLIQGAGGNTSYKVAGRMLVKASGKWLADSRKENIFVDVDLSRIRKSIESNLENPLQGAVSDNALLKPSIETTLHAVMAHKIVVHTHAIDVISIAVTETAQSRFSSLLQGLRWAWVEYAKPGIELTKQVVKAIDGNEIDILILGNHGLVVGGETCSEVDELMIDIQSRCKLGARVPNYEVPNLTASSFSFGSWTPSEDHTTNGLALDEQSNAIFKKGIIYPDQAVFLGGKPCFVNSEENPERVIEAYHYEYGVYPTYYVHQHFGVYISALASNSLAVMLKCHADVLIRIDSHQHIKLLSLAQVSELLDWDAEKYRQAMEKPMRSN